jgi:adenine-specific DNA-methyltransferase
MPTLDWIGKKAVVNHHRDVPYRLIHCDKDKSVGDPDAGNLLVQGDNLEALKALLPYYAGKVKCIYIDPPYNTGNEGWVYNDNVNSPEIKAWLGDVVGPEAEDLSRHDKWLCMMYPRLRLLKEFLSDDGAIFISCDDSEHQNLKTICDDIFGKKNHAATFVWNTEGNTDNQLLVKINHEYIISYYANFKFRKYAIGSVIDPNTRKDSNLLAGFADNNITKNGTKNPPHEILLPIGFPCSNEKLNLPKENVDDLFFKTAFEQREISRSLQIRYKISRIPVRLDNMVVEAAKLVSSCRVFSGWANANKLKEFIENGCNPIQEGEDEIHFYLNANGCVRYRKSRATARNILSVLRELGTTERSKNELRRMGVDFSYPKPVDLISYILRFGAEDDEALVLDSFGGSGTTAHSLLKNNIADGANRRFIVIELDNKIAKEVTAKRLATAVKGYEFSDKSGKVTKVDGLGSGFRFCTLGEPLFDADGNVSPAVTYPDLAAHVFFCETGSPIPRRAEAATALIGTFQDRAIYLLHNAQSLGVASANAGNVLTGGILDALPLPEPGFTGARIVYGEGCTVPDERLSRLGVTFKQIPYQIEGL